jgi:rubredoxin
MAKARRSGPRKNASFCCEAMQEALTLRPPVLMGELGRSSLGIVVYNSFCPGRSYESLPRQLIRNCPWCGNVVSRRKFEDDIEETARPREQMAAHAGIRRAFPRRACPWLQGALAQEDTFIVFGQMEGLLLPRFSARLRGGRLTGTGLPVWFCPWCGEEIEHEHPKPPALPGEERLPLGTNHPRY